MNILILDSWLREHLKTKATPKEIAEKLSLTSVGIERVHKHGNDFIYDIEVTTNRPDLASIVGLAREAAAVLPQHGFEAEFIPPKLTKDIRSEGKKVPLTIENNNELIHRICAVVLEVKLKPSPKQITERLETSDIRSLNNVIDVTNYVMRVIGHPTHVFDYDRLEKHTLKIRKSKTGEKITTLDGKEYTLPGGDIVAVDASGKIVDLIGIMGLENSVVTDNTKRVLFFIDNNDTKHIRETSMKLGIRTEAAQLNEKGIDIELAYDALLYGIQLFQEIADAKIISEIIDIYPQKKALPKVSVSLSKVQQYLGVPISLETSKEILTKLGFETTSEGETIQVTVPSIRSKDVSLPEDLIEEIARVYGYHNIPSRLPNLLSEPVKLEENYFYWEKRVKEMFKYWGFTEVYTYSMIPEDMYEGPLEDAVTIANPLSEEFVYMRSSLIMSLLKVVSENKTRERIKIFEIANVYYKTPNNLPQEIRFLSGVIKKPQVSFFEVKGLIEQLAKDLGIQNLTFKSVEHGSVGAEVWIRHEKVGEIEILDEEVINFEINFDELLKHVSLKKSYTPLAKYPAIIEDMSFILSDDVLTGDVIKTILEQSKLITEVSLLDRYGESRTFHILYQDKERNLTSEDVAPIREKVERELSKKFQAKLKA